jgi:hypothetical protein
MNVLGTHRKGVKHPLAVPANLLNGFGRAAALRGIELHWGVA